MAEGLTEQPNVFSHINLLSFSLGNHRVLQGKLGVALHSHKVVDGLWPLINLQLCGCVALSMSFAYPAATLQLLSDLDIVPNYA